MNYLNKCLILFIILSSCCLHRPRPLWVEPICHSTTERASTIKTLYIKGKVKLRGLGYGFCGDIYLIAMVPSRLRVDIVGPLWPLSSLAVIKDNFSLLIYPKGKVYSGNTKFLPVELRDLIYLLGQQTWPVYAEHVVYASDKRDAYYIKSFNDPLIEEVWLRKDTLRVERIKIKNKKKRSVFEARLSYKDGKVRALKIKVNRIEIELTYLAIEKNIGIKESAFRLITRLDR